MYGGTTTEEHLALTTDAVDELDEIIACAERVNRDGSVE